MSAFEANVGKSRMSKCFFRVSAKLSSCLVATTSTNGASSSTFSFNFLPRFEAPAEAAALFDPFGGGLAVVTDEM